MYQWTLGGGVVPVDLRGRGVPVDYMYCTNGPRYCLYL